MDLKLNPFLDKSFASCSLDYSIKFWNLNDQYSLFTLNGHTAGVNCISFSQTERKTLISGGDDLCVLIWDLDKRNIIRKIEKHSENITDVIFFKDIDFFASISEDGVILIHSEVETKIEQVISPHLEKGWSLDIKDNYLVAAFDQGCYVLHIGSEYPVFAS